MAILEKVFIFQSFLTRHTLTTGMAMWYKRYGNSPLCNTKNSSSRAIFIKSKPVYSPKTTSFSPRSSPFESFLTPPSSGVA